MDQYTPIIRNFSLTYLLFHMALGTTCFLYVSTLSVALICVPELSVVIDN